MSMECRWCWRLKTWDHFRIPLPFGRIVITLHPLLEVPREVDDDELSRLRLQLEKTLQEGLDDLLPENDE